MRASLYFTLLLLFCASHSLGQKDFAAAKADSLNTILETSDNAKTRYDAAFALAKLYRRKKPKRHEDFARQALREAENANYTKGIAIALGEIGRSFQYADSYDSAQFYYHKSIPYFEKPGNKASVFALLSNLEKAQGHYPASFDLLLRADSIFTLEKNEKGLLMTNTNLGILLSLQEEHEKALLYFGRAEGLLAEKDYKKRSQLYSNFAATYLALQQIDAAENYNQQSIEIKLKLNDIFGLALAYGTKASIASELRKPQEAIAYAEKGLDYAQQANSAVGEVRTLNQLGNLHRQAGDRETAKTYLLRARDLIQSLDSYDAAMNNAEALYMLHRDNADWREAMVEYKHFQDLRDSIFQVEKTEIIQKMQSRFDNQRLQQEKTLAESQAELSDERSRNSRNLSWGLGILSLFILAGAVAWVLRQRETKRSQLLALELKESEKRLHLEQRSRMAELKALQSQMNPHFVFNALNSIQDLILLQDVRNSNKYLVRFSNLLRNILDSSTKGWIAVAEEISILEDYTALELLRFGDDLEIDIISKLSPTQERNTFVPAMFLQPYVENALKHGLLPKTAAKRLQIVFQIKNNMLEVIVEDNGVGRARAATANGPKGLGFATQANTLRMELINSELRGEVQVHYHDLNEEEGKTGTRVSIKIPAQKNLNSPLV